jgi:HNH endonuclease
MADTYIDQAIALLEKSNAGLEPELLTASTARELLDAYARAEKLAAFGVAALARKVASSAEVARATGSSAGKAQAVVRTGEAMAASAELSAAMQTGSVSLDQAAEIARAEEASPGAATELLSVARTETFHVLKEKARKVALEAEQHRDLGRRQREARSGRSYSDELGMVHLHVAMEPHLGTPVVARAEADAARLAKEARKTGVVEPFERYLADAFAAMLTGGGKGRARRSELVVVVSHEVAKRGWTGVRDGEVCKIPGVGPVAPEVAKEIAEDAFLSGVFYDGTDLRQFKRWSRAIPVEVAVALELGSPPDFDGVSCVDCGNRFRTEFDHVQPRFAHGPTSHPNLKPRCWRCHQAKRKRERSTGMARSGEP